MYMYIVRGSITTVLPGNYDYDSEIENVLLDYGAAAAVAEGEWNYSDSREIASSTTIRYQLMLDDIIARAPG